MIFATLLNSEYYVKSIIRQGSFVILLELGIIWGQLPSSKRLSGSTFCPNVIRFMTGTAFWKVPRLRLSVFLVRAKCRRRWLWSVGGMVLTGETGALEEKLVHHKPHKNWPEFEPGTLLRCLATDTLSCGTANLEREWGCCDRHYEWNR